MFPLYDSTPRHRFPFINYLLIGLNIFVFLVQLSSPDPEAFIYDYSFIPVYFNLLDPTAYLYVVSSIFLHGGIVHLLSNIWFLHIFGDNVEDVMGHIPYLLFYLASGLVATLAQYYVAPGAEIPLIGASGAISGIAGAYFVLFRHSKVTSLVTFFVIWFTTKLPAWIFLGYWFLLQLFAGIGSFVDFDINRGGVAWFAHLGGFVFGWIATAFIYSRGIREYDPQDAD